MVEEVAIEDVVAARSQCHSELNEYDGLRACIRGMAPVLVR
jgi:hypothetical protein